MQGINSCSRVDGEWIVAKKDWQEAKKRAKSKESRDEDKERREKETNKSTQQSSTADSASTEDPSESGYTPDMDEQRCILYFHGGKSPSGLWTSFADSDCLVIVTVGGYYFGSVDQERYSIQRFARKINGRVFGKPTRFHQVFHSTLHCDCHNPLTLVVVLRSDFSHALSNVNLPSHQLPPQPTVSVPVCNPRCHRRISVSHPTSP